MATQFVNPFAAFYTGWQNVLNQQEEKRQQRVKEQQEEEKLRMDREREARAEKERAKREEETNLRMRETQQKIDAQTRVQAEKDIRQAGMGGTLRGAQAEQAQANVPFMVSDFSAAAPDVTVPSLPAPMLEGVDGGPGMQLPPAPPEQITGLPATAVSKGTPDQRAIQTIIDNPELSDKEKVAILMQGGVDLNTAEAKMLMGDTDVSWQRFNGRREGATEDELFFANPKTRQIMDSTGKPVTERITPVEGDQSNMPFRGQALTTGSGIVGATFDQRTGTWKTDRLADLRPGATGAGDLRKALLIQDQIDAIREVYNPEKVGVIMGRLNNLNQKFWGSDPEYATFKSELTTLLGTIVQLRTGAQMSVEEAKRIGNEVASETLPPATLVARLNRAEALYKETVARIAQIEYGRVTPEDVSKMIETGGTPNPVRTPEPSRGAGPGPGPAAQPEYKEEIVNGVKIRRRVK